MKAGTHSPWISRLLKRVGLEVITANACRLRAIYDNDRKCDCADAMMLARQRAGLVNCARARLESLGLRIKLKTCAASVPQVSESLGPQGAMLAAVLERICAAIEESHKRTAEHNQQIAQAIQERHPQAAKLNSIAGAGPITLLGFVWGMEYPERFRDVRGRGSLCGPRAAARPVWQQRQATAEQQDRMNLPAHIARAVHASPSRAFWLGQHVAPLWAQAHEARWQGSVEEGGGDRDAQACRGDARAVEEANR